eukprot:TRINITY_DN80881_c0_g1_i1.p1 TRINITY_DN80881_c0_g1~~TRINITY_DN80881_c0_g1_i1.p1  ORF type:complete len:413 (-),score=55.75 TRINITY_DN80881_c0_g1_i1:29-1267(-)
MVANTPTADIPSLDSQLWHPDDGAPASNNMVDNDPLTPQLLDEANMYILVCQFAYHPVKDTALKQFLQEKWNLHLVHIHNDPTKELRYIVMRQDPPASEGAPENQPPKPLRYIIGFRGLKHSFDFADLRPFVEPSPTSKNRRHFMVLTELVTAPECLGVEGGEVHQGLLDYFLRLSTTMPEALQDWVRVCDSVPLTACGFSMGCLLSAYTSLFMLNYIRMQGKEPTIGVFNFCAPKIGNKVLVDALHSRMQSYYSVHMQGDPVASFPDREGYELGGSFILVKENEYATPNQNPEQPKVKKWKAELISNERGPIHQSVVTLEQMRVGVEGSALPSFSTIQSCKKYHRMDVMKEVCASPPLRSFEVEQLRIEMERRKAERVQLYAKTGKATDEESSGFDCFLCPARGENRVCWS